MLKYLQHYDVNLLLTICQYFDLRQQTRYKFFTHLWYFTPRFEEKSTLGFKSESDVDSFAKLSRHKTYRTCIKCHIYFSISPFLNTNQHERHSFEYMSQFAIKMFVNDISVVVLKSSKLSTGKGQNFYIGLLSWTRITCTF